MKNDELAKMTSGIEFENDFGQETLFFGRIVKDQGGIAVLSLASAFVGTAVAGLPLAVILLLVGLNDIFSVTKTQTVNKKKEEEPEAIDVEAQQVEMPGLPMIEQKAQPADSKPLANS